jgi:C-terminal processing protease CtpA/Prc
MKLKAYVTFIFISFAIWGFSQTVEIDNKFTVKELQEDFSVLRKHLEQKNPITYLYNSKELIQLQFDEIEKSINRPMTEIEFYQLISPISSMIYDGHNLIMPSDLFLSTFDKSKKNFPYQLQLMNNELYVIKNMSSNDSIHLGDKIIAINGRSTEEIIQRLFKVLPREGNQTQYPEFVISRWFGFFYNIHFGLNEYYDIQYENEKVGLKSVKIKGEKLDTIIARRVLKYPVSELRKKGISVKIIDEELGIAMLSIPTFASSFLKNKYNQKSFKREINKAFDIINKEGVKHLIIDIRSNGGGNPAFATYVLKYLFQQRFEQVREARVVSNERIGELMSRTKKKWFPFYGEGFFGTFKPKKVNYKNDLYVFINGGTFSSAVEFASTLKKYNRAVFIGTKTGGNPIIMTGNYLKESRNLPNTKIKHYSGFICTIYDDLELNTGNGLIPNYEVKLTLNDILSNEDKCLEVVMNLIINTNN